MNTMSRRVRLSSALERFHIGRKQKPLQHSCVVAFSDGNPDSTFPEIAPMWTDCFAFGPLLGLDSYPSQPMELSFPRPDPTNGPRDLMFSRRSPNFRIMAFAIIAGAMAGLASGRAGAEALLLVDVDTGKVLHAENATYPWYPASVTKLMTTYTTLRAVRQGRITLDSLFTVSANAAVQAPTKMGFAVGTKVTVDNAIKMLMGKSANDM